jgi:uncharacterized XkdX family phage protein
MDWFQFALIDFRIYKEPERIKQYVLKEKITAEHYQQITGETYTA